MPTPVETSSETIDVRLVTIAYAAHDTNLYTFRALDGGLLPAVEPGAHIDVHLPTGVVRQYSLVTPGKALREYVIGVKREEAGGGGSRYMHDELRVGGCMRISSPRNHFPLHEDAEHSVLIAGGIGITPIWAMVQRLIERGRSWELHYAGRTRADAALVDALENLASVHFSFDDENEGRFLDLKRIVQDAPRGSHFYCCGPAPMLGAFTDATADFPPERVHLEYFVAKEAPATEGGFVVELTRSGRTVQIPAGKTILEMLRDLGLDLPSSCETGVCGTCETRVLEGVPDHRDAVLSPVERAANDTMMICCSGSKSQRLVLDL